MHTPSAKQSNATYKQGKNTQDRWIGRSVYCTKYSTRHSQQGQKVHRSRSNSSTTLITSSILQQKKVPSSLLVCEAELLPIAIPCTVHAFSVRGILSLLASSFSSLDSTLRWLHVKEKKGKSFVTHTNLCGDGDKAAVGLSKYAYYTGVDITSGP